MKGLIFKVVSILLWTMTIGTMLLFIDLIDTGKDASLMTKWIKIMSMTLFGSVGIAHISHLFEIDNDKFHPDNVYSISIMILGALCLFMGIILNAKENYGSAWNFFGGIVIIVSMIAIFKGSLISEPNKNP